jgi:hypothetical protein
MATTEKDVQHQIQILATNLEILNQKIGSTTTTAKLATDPALLTSLSALSGKIEQLKEVLKPEKAAQIFEKQRVFIEQESLKLSQAVAQLEQFEQQTLTQTSARIQALNQHIDALVKNIEITNANMEERIKIATQDMYRVLSDQINKSTSKVNLYMILFTTGVAINSVIVMIALLIIIFKALS